MKIILKFIFAFLLITTFSNAETVTTNVNNVPLQKSTLDSCVIDTIPSNSTLEKISESGAYYNIRFNNTTGWIAKKYTNEGKASSSIQKVNLNTIVKTDLPGAAPAVTADQLKFVIENNGYCGGARRGNLLALLNSFMQVQEQYKVNALFAVSVAICESGAGSGGNLITKYNSYNMFSIQGSYQGQSVSYNGAVWKKYPNFSASVLDFGNLIANVRYYFPAKNYTISSIGKYYCDAVWSKAVAEKMNSFYITLRDYPGQKDNLYSEIESSTSNSSQKKIIYVGDSRVVQMASHVPASKNNTIYIAKGAQGLEWLKNTGYSQIKSVLNSYPNSAVVFCLGVNDRYNIDKYINYYKNTVLKELSGKEIYFMTVNPVNESIGKQNGYSVYNSSIVEFNNKLKASFPNKIIDTYSVLINYMGNGTTDGIHYTASTSELIHKTTLKYINN